MKSVLFVICLFFGSNALAAVPRANINEPIDTLKVTQARASELGTQTREISSQGSLDKNSIRLIRKITNRFKKDLNEAIELKSE